MPLELFICSLRHQCLTVLYVAYLGSVERSGDLCTRTRPIAHQTFRTHHRSKISLPKSLQLLRNGPNSANTSDWPIYYLTPSHISINFSNHLESSSTSHVSLGTPRSLDPVCQNWRTFWPTFCQTFLSPAKILLPILSLLPSFLPFLPHFLPILSGLTVQCWFHPTRPPVKTNHFKMKRNFAYRTGSPTSTNLCF